MSRHLKVLFLTASGDIIGYEVNGKATMGVWPWRNDRASSSLLSIWGQLIFFSIFIFMSDLA